MMEAMTRTIDDDTTMGDLTDWHRVDRIDCPSDTFRMTETGVICEACGWVADEDD